MNATVVTFAGHLADAPELRFTPNGRAVAKVRVAVNERYQNSTGDWVDGNTSWYTVQVTGSSCTAGSGSAPTRRRPGRSGTRGRSPPRRSA
jgi:single-stranded DNA-binding protein